MSERYRHYYGYCDECEVVVHAEVGPDAGPDGKLPDRDDWDSFGLTCPVCSDTVPGGYDGADDTTTEDRLLLWQQRAWKAERALAATPPPPNVPVAADVAGDEAGEV